MTDNIKENIEDKVIDCINFGVPGRLIIYKPEKSILGADLVVERKGKYREKEMFFQVNYIIGPAKDTNFVKDFLQEDYKTGKNFYLLFVYFDEVEQKLIDYIWLIPSSQFKDMADTIILPDGKNALRFQSLLFDKNNHAKRENNKYDKFLVNTNELGKLILGAFERGGKFTFKELGFDEENLVNTDNLKEFLCEARRNVYSVSASAVDSPRLLASTQLDFQRGDYSYRNIYFPGEEKVIGQEIVYKSSKPIWGMNYIGGAIKKLEDIFLTESLFKLSDKCRLGQVCEYEKREFKYQDSGKGALEDFFGEESVFLHGEKIYKLNYQGGLIFKKL